MYPKIILKSGKADAVKRFHPWIFSGAIKKIKEPVQSGDIVAVFSNQEEFLALGHYQHGTSIAVRLFSFEERSIDTDFWKEKLLSAYQLRRKLGLFDNASTNSFRLVYAEGDSLPGLIMDYYNGTVVIQCHSYGMHLIRQELCDALQQILDDKLKAVYYKSKETLGKSTSEEITNEYLYGESTDNIIAENNCLYQVDWEQGQKTGFFLDQRDNRKLLSEYSKGKKILNCFSYSGGFSVSALKNGATLVHSVDSSSAAIGLCEENLRINGFDSEKHQCFVSDVMDFMQNMAEEYDIIVVDPPAYAKSISAKHNAIQGYKRLNKMAMDKIKAGGLIFSFSCSQVVDRRMFNATLQSAAIQSGRKIRILHELSQAACHPLNAFHPEGHYLKGLVLYVE